MNLFKGFATRKNNKMNNKKRVLSGMRATGRLHLGNYLGAIKGMIELQENPEYETSYMVADVHAITTPYDVEQLRTNRIEVVLDYLAAGLDPKKANVFLQSEVPQHLEFAFYLSSFVTIARMQHLPTFKEKVKQYPENATLALLNYPVLMASDILLYKAHEVPVGIDQEPHLEVSREIARKLNNAYDLDFPEPVIFKTTGAYVPSLTGAGKMSKSVEGSYINLTDDLETIKARLAKVPTDSGTGEVQQGDRMSYKSGGNEQLGVATLMELVEHFEGSDQRKTYEEQYASSGVRYGDLKNQLAEAIHKDLAPIQSKRHELENNMDYVRDVLTKGAEKSREMTQKTVDELKQKMGF